MRVVICWAGISGYALACWEALAALSGVKLKILALPYSSAFEEKTKTRLDLTILCKEEYNCSKKIAKRVVEFRPDVVVISGWVTKGYNGLPFCKELQSASFFLAMDTPWRGDLRQNLARYKLRRFVKRMDGVFVASQHGITYAHKLGFKEEQISPAMYGHDYNAFAPAYERRLNDRWPKSFVYLGRYAPAKGLDILIAAYKKYYKRVENPWPLECYGKGVLADMLHDIPGVNENGFLLPKDIPEMFVSQGVLVMPSSYEPWGVVLAEAGAAGLPSICSNAVGASIDLVRNLYNGYIVAPNDVEGLARALEWMHSNYDRLPDMGRISQVYAGAYSAEKWAERWYHLLTTLRNI